MLFFFSESTHFYTTIFGHLIPQPNPVKEDWRRAFIHLFYQFLEQLIFSYLLLCTPQTTGQINTSSSTRDCTNIHKIGYLCLYLGCSFCGFVSSSFVFLGGTFPLLVRFLLFPVDELLFMSDQTLLMTGSTRASLDYLLL